MHNMIPFVLIILLLNTPFKFLDIAEMRVIHFHLIPIFHFLQEIKIMILVLLLVLMYTIEHGGILVVILQTSMDHGLMEHIIEHMQME